MFCIINFIIILNIFILFSQFGAVERAKSAANLPLSHTDYRLGKKGRWRYLIATFEGNSIWL